MAVAAITADNPFLRTNAMANASDASGNSASKPSSISSNDFLTLLVTEMKNQDPTAQTDPNEYVNQLVQVNSLEQLIEMNQNLSTALGDTGTSSTGSTTAHAVIGSRLGAAAPLPSTAAPAGSQAMSRQVSVPATSGNLSVPREVPAAQRLAQALGGRS